jgi:Calcineurin-like phosphoesterase
MAAAPIPPTLIVGDVHGDLERLFGALKPYPPDRWRTIFLGDLVDGGPVGVGAIRYARDRPASTVLLGNHEVLMLGALRDRAERGPGLRSWLGAGGQPHDLEELARDVPLQDWLRTRPAMQMLEDRTLVQHCDSDDLARLVPATAPDPVERINEEVVRLLAEGETARLVELMTPRGVFRRQPHRLESWLRRTGARRVVHGHTPHRSKEPDVYAGGLAINFDGGMGRWGRPGAFRGGSVRGSVGPLPQ